ncbi:tRNA selenocysteine 1-associated protein 1-like isoform X2 [Lampris incognitus]|uniref:tRNA selenocysteine 1-associated protein 1-like isoform X2 n=1 Tax=Lampris incognitus TaxID=2546036 RepID=UPI0024B50F8F|nr:tRNA selenocysteine 1-associated protein 1-like isoform X2 [Lampris incognitus]
MDASGYCFVELADEATAERCLRKVNGKPLPGASPPRRFKLNRATYGRQGENRTNYSDSSHHQQYYYSDNQYYQQYSNYCSNWGYDLSAGNNGSYYYDHYDYNNQSYGDAKDEGLEDPLLELDVVEANRQFISESEELYDALIDCHWSVLVPPTPPHAQ